MDHHLAEGKSLSNEVSLVNEIIELAAADEVEITSLYENLVDNTAPGREHVERLDYRRDKKIVSTLLADEQSNPFVGGHGLSMQVKVTRDGITRSILFDAGGAPDGLVHNLDCLEINPRDFNCVVLSHGHWDHTHGLIGLQKRMGGRLDVPLTLHPDAFLKRAIVGQDGKVNALTSLSRQGLLDAGVELIETENPSFVVEGSALVTGQVERTNDFEIGWPAHHTYRNEKLEPDPLVCDDQGLVINLKGKGLVVLSGCGHAGIVNTVSHAQAITGVEKVHAVIGGFHLGPTFFQDRIRPVVDALIALEPAIISPAHCAGHLAANAIFQARPESFVQNMVGTRITLKADDQE